MNRKKAREKLVLGFYESDIKNQPLLVEGDNDLISMVVFAYTQNTTEIDDCIEQHLEKWKLRRLGFIERAILRVATTELLYVEELSKEISISEALKLANIYCEDNSIKLINGVLHAIGTKK